MPDGINTSTGPEQQMVQRGFPRRRFPQGSYPRRRFPMRVPVRQRIPRFFYFPIGFPTGRCYYIDRYGRCCDRYGRCCDRYGRCYYDDRFEDRMAYGPSPTGGWYGVPGGWDMMPDYDDMGEMDGEY